MTRVGAAAHRSAWLLAALVLWSAACAAPAPSPSEQAELPGANYALACWSVQPADCHRVAAEAVARLPVGAPPAAALRVADGRLVAALADGDGTSEIEWSLEPGAPVGFGAWEAVPSARVGPASAPDQSPVIPLTLGHCGLDSPIDVDGALWDPHGPIPADAPAVLNATDGEFRRTGVTTAMFVTRTGVRVELRRHAGAGSYRLCD